jgi:hypothetical protein
MSFRVLSDMFNKVLTATAKPRECDASIKTGAGIARYNNSKLLILNVLDPESLFKTANWCYLHSY